MDASKRRMIDFWPDLVPGEAPVSVTQLRYCGCWQDAADLLEGPAVDDPAAAQERAAVLVEQCMFATTGWDDAEVAVVHARSIAVTDAQRGAAISEHGYLAYVATVLRGSDRASEADHLLKQAVDLVEEDSVTRAWIEFRRGLVAQNLRDEPDSAGRHFEQAHRLATAHGDPLLRSYTTRHLGGMAEHDGDIEAAVTWFTESLHLRYDCGFTVGIAPALAALADVSDPGDAERLRAEAAVLVRALGGIPTWMALDPA
jgi:hypothetical protein